MTKIFLCFAVVLLSVSIQAQTDHSGNYGFSFPVPKELHPPKNEKNAGAMGDLTLFKIDSVQYKFWLNVNRGYPSYNMGYLDGIIAVKNNKAIFRQKQDYTDSTCVMVFDFNKNYIQMEQRSSDFDCGFGHNVFADGKYDKKDSYKLKNADLKKQYIEIERYQVDAAKAFVFEDSSGIKQKKQYFIKGDIVFSPAENDAYAYVEYITASGKFIYGWLKKSDLKTIK